MKNNMLALIVFLIAVSGLWANIDIPNAGFDLTGYEVQNWTFNSYIINNSSGESFHPGQIYHTFYPEGGNYVDPTSTVAYLQENFFSPSGGEEATDGPDYVLQLISDSFQVDQAGLYSVAMNLWTTGPDAESDYFKAILTNLGNNNQTTYNIWTNHADPGPVPQYYGTPWQSGYQWLESGSYNLTYALYADNQLDNLTSVGVDNVNLILYQSDPTITVPVPSAIGLALSGIALLRRKIK